MQIAYPKISFWDTNAPLIEFINSGDFHRQELLQSLGLSGHPLADSFGTSDRDEILRRQQLVKYLHQHGELSTALYELVVKVSGIPTSGQGFTEYFNLDQEHNPFWTQLIGLVKTMDDARAKETLPPALEQFFQFLSSTRQEAEVVENVFAEQVIGEILKMTTLHGVMKFRVSSRNHGHDLNIKYVDGSAYGHRRFSFHRSDEYHEWKRPWYLNWWGARWTGAQAIGDAIIAKHNEKIKRLAFETQLIDNVPDIFATVIANKLKRVFDEELGMDRNERLSLVLHFSFDQSGFRVTLINFNAWLNEEKEDGIRSVQFNDRFVGYSPRKVKKVRRKSLKLSVQAGKTLCKSRLWYRVSDALCDAFPGIHGVSGGQIDSSEVDRTYRWYEVNDHFLQRDEFGGRYQKLQRYRNFVADQVRELRQIVEITDALRQRANKWEMPLTYPTILDEGAHLVSFDSLYPIHLMTHEGFKPKQLVPIETLSALNGNMLGLTGQNAGGKTVTEETIVGKIFMAQSGLPIFGTGFALNPKSQIGLVFLERGEGSTLELMLRKSRAVLEAIEDSDSNGFVIVLDEVGTGTQQMAGLTLGRKLLSKLAESGCSVIFSTQITELAEFAESELNAQCFQFDLDHQISTGIGTGGAELLIEQLEMQDLLN